jgi:predicted nucleotidyltransferase
MRLTQQEIQIIKSSVHEVMGEDANVWLFGSRVDNNKRGGDIDLLVEVDLPEPRVRILKKSQLWAKLQSQLGEQRIDIILAETKFGKPKLIEQVAREMGIRL